METFWGNFHLLSDFQHVFQTYWPFLIFIVTSLVIAGYFFFPLFARLSTDTISIVVISAETAQVFFVVGAFLSFLFNAVVIVWVFIFVLAIMSRRYWLGPSKNKKTIGVSQFTGLIFLLAWISIVKLSFLSGLSYPLYSDSAYHFDLINKIMGGNLSSLLFSSNGLLNYYHYGFHSIVALFSLVSGLPVEKSMLILGQVLQISIPISFYPIGKMLTHKAWGGILAVTIAAFGWSMPAYASNWGKYPAILGVQFFLWFYSIYLLIQKKDVPQKSLFSLLFTLVCLFIGLIFHARIVIVIVLFFVIQKLVEQHTMVKKYTHLNLFLFVALLGNLILLYINDFEDFQHIYIKYLQESWVSALLLLLFARFVRHQSKQLFYQQVIFSVILLVMLNTSIPYGLLTRDVAHLIDRPFLEVILFIPLTLIMTIAVTNFTNMLLISGKRIRSLRIYRAVAIVFLVAVSLFIYPVRSSCCVILDPPNITVIQRIKAELPSNTKILIAAGRWSGYTEAGIWIYPLTGIQTVKWPYDTDFEKDVQQNLCKQRVMYIYVGNTAYSFSRLSLQNANIGQELFQVNGVSLFKLDCLDTPLESVR